jgi:hypothetical protein
MSVVSSMARISPFGDSLGADGLKVVVGEGTEDGYDGVECVNVQGGKGTGVGRKTHLGRNVVDIATLGPI